MLRGHNRVSVSHQLETLTELAELPADRLTPEQLEIIFKVAARPANDEVQMRAAALLSELYPALAPNTPTSRSARTRFSYVICGNRARRLRTPHAVGWC